MPKMPMENNIFAKPFLSLLHFHLQTSKGSFYALISVFSLFLLAYNSATVFYTQVPISAIIPPETSSISPGIVAGKPRKPLSSYSSAKLETHFSLLHKNQNLVVPTNETTAYRPRDRREGQDGDEETRFEVRVMDFFGDSCKLRFFMTWISSSVDSFGDREIFAVNHLFKSHPHGSCLIIASNSLDSRNGTQFLGPLLKMGFKVTAISPDYNYLFKGTPAEEWYNQLMRGNVNPGEIPLGQNLSNLLRLGLLYKFGGIYLDTDVIVLKNLGGLKNAIGAQSIDLETKNWSRLNNAVMIFDESHPLLYKFIQEFALTFDGNKWGHNGPYLVSRVVTRVSGRPGYNFTILPPMAFYPVDWSRIGRLFEGPKNLSHSKWLLAKLEQIRSSSFAIHLWNKQSRGIEVEKGSVVQHIMFGS